MIKDRAIFQYVIIYLKTFVIADVFLMLILIDTNQTSSFSLIHFGILRFIIKEIILHSIHNFACHVFDDNLNTYIR